MKITRFEDLIVWQKARVLANLVYQLTSVFPSSEKYGLVDQIRRSAVSVTANVAEGFSRYHLKETLMFYRNARGSLTELKSHFYIAFDQKYLAKKNLDILFDNIDEVGKMLNGLINKTDSFRKSSRL